MPPNTRPPTPQEAAEMIKNCLSPEYEKTLRKWMLDRFGAQFVQRVEHESNK
jgi:hypothetical protein